MKRLAQIIGVLFLIWIIYRPITHFFCVPLVVHSSWVEPLATEGTGYRHNAELFTGGEDVRKLYDKTEIEPVFRASEQKRRLFETLRVSKGSLGLFRRYSSVEGDPILDWLIVQDGRLTYVHDSSRDGGAPPWAVYVCTPLDFKLGFMRKDEFVEGEPTTTDSPIIVFQFKEPNRLDRRYFY
jgi:hypothetical protein